MRRFADPNKQRLRLGAAVLDFRTRTRCDVPIESKSCLNLSDRRSVLELMVVPWRGTHIALGWSLKLDAKRIDIIYRSVPFWKLCNVRSTKGCETLGWGSARSPVQISSAISLAVVVCFITRCFAPPRLCLTIM